MKQLRIKDNSITNKENFSEIGSVVKRISDKTLEQLEKDGVFVFPELLGDAEDITRDQMVLQSFNDSYRTGNVMGFLGCGDERLIIESRFSLSEEDHFFQYLLEQVLDFPNIVNFEIDANQDKKMFRFFLFLFPSYLRSAMRKGIFKTYIRNNYNNENVKGNIDVARHIKNNTPFIGNIAYNQRVYSYDNVVMELVRHTIEFIKSKPYGNKVLSRVKDEVKIIIDVTPQYNYCSRLKVINSNKSNIVRHAFYKEYRALQQLCFLILQNEKHQIGVGSRNVFGILFDGAWLWEEYMNMLVGDIFYHPMNKNHKGAQWLFSGNNGLVYPDFISKDLQKRIIADAKYKPKDNIGNKDYLQILAYMFRFDAKQAFFIYPEKDNKEDLKLWVNKGCSFEKNVVARNDVLVSKHGFRIPSNAVDYNDFVIKMKESEAMFVFQFKSLTNSDNEDIL